MLSAQRPIEARAPGRRHDLRLLVLGLMRPEVEILKEVKIVKEVKSSDSL